MRKGWKIFWFVFTVLLVVSLCVFFYWSRPWWHGLIMALFCRYPHFLFSIIVALAIGILFGFIPRRYEGGYNGELATGMFFVSWIVLWIVFSCYQGWYSQRDMAYSIKSKIEQIEELPDITSVRILPRAVARRYAKDALQYPRYQLGGADITFVDGKQAWAFPLRPDGIVNMVNLKGKGMIYVRMDTQEKNTTVFEKRMNVGPGMGIKDNVFWRLRKEKFWRAYEDLYSVLYEDDLYFAVPLRKFKWRFQFPTVYTVPEFDGVALIHSSGKIDFLSPEEAANHPVLQGQKVFSEYMARYQINSLQYAKGINNKLWHHKDQLEIADVARGQNRQPFLVETSNGLDYLIAAEPYGSAHGIFKIFLIDARTGKIRYFKQPATDTLIGPVKACDYVRKASPRISWDTMSPVEPIPIIRESVLYWEIRIIPKDAAGVSYTAFVDSRSGYVLEFEEDADIKAFIQGYEVVSIKADAEKKKVGKKEEKTHITVVIISPDGTRKEIQLEKGSKLIIQ